MGSFTVELYANHSPRTCTNFIELSRRGYYDNVKFHRIIKDFIVQGGNPTGTGRGGQSIYEGFLGKFGDEIHLELKHTGAGILSMANACPNTNGSQFFITLAPCPSLESIMPQPEMSYDPLSSHRLFTESPSGLLNSLSRHGRSSDGLRSFVPGSPSQAGISRSLMNLDSFNRYNMDGIAEVLSSLERINFHDHHRDMRLDIDNMSYEELLALEERMGTVSTALTDEALSKCLETSVYQLVPQEHLAIDSDESKDDVKCSICQEEYAVGDEVGRLRCDHKYHTVCVNQWLRLKNWCPICKSPAEPSPPLSNV